MTHFYAYGKSGGNAVDVSEKLVQDGVALKIDGTSSLDNNEVWLVFVKGIPVKVAKTDTGITWDEVAAYRPLDKEYMLSRITGATTVTFKNTLKPRTVTVKKNLIGGDLSKEFTFTAHLTKDNSDVADYAILSDDDGGKTDSNGKISFTLSGNGSVDLKVPYGSHLTVEEEKNEGDDYSTAYSVDGGEEIAIADATQPAAVINGDSTKGITANHEVVFTNTAEFSVLPEEGTVTYEFYLDEACTKKYEYALASNTDLNQTTHRQILRNGSVLVLPEQPKASGDDEGKVFKGWFREDGTEETDFGKNITVNDANKDKTIKLYAKFADVRYVVFHENQTTDENDNLFWPVMKTMAVEKNSEGKYTIDLTGIEPVVQDVTREFKGWAYSATVPEGADSLTDKIDGTEPYDFTDKGGSIDLYPMFTQKVRVSFWTGESGTGAPYVATVLVNEGSPIGEALPENPAWKGRIFDGWYMNYNRETLEYADPVESTSMDPVDGDTTIYAKWHYEVTSTYTIALWKQKAKPENVNSTDKVNYDFAGSVSRSGNTMSLVSLTDAETRSLFSSTGFTGFTFKKADPTTISPDGDTIIDVFYNREVYTIDIYPVPANSQDFSYSGKKDDKYVETTEDAPGTKYGFVNGEYVEVHKELVGWKGMADTENHNNLALYQLSDGHWVYPINGITAYEDQWFYTQYSYTSGIYTYKTDYIGNTNTVTATAGSPAEGTTVWLSSNQLGYTGTAPRTDRFYGYITGNVKSNSNYQDITYNAYIRYQAVAYYRWVDVNSNIYDVDGGEKLYRMASGKVASMDGLYGADIPWPVNETGQNYIILFNEKHEKGKTDDYYKNPTTKSFKNVTMIPTYRFESISETGGKVALSTDGKKWVLYAADSDKGIGRYAEFYKLPNGMTVEDFQTKIAGGDDAITPNQTVITKGTIKDDATQGFSDVHNRWAGYSLYEYRSVFGTTKSSYQLEVDWRKAYTRDSERSPGKQKDVYDIGGSITLVNKKNDKVNNSVYQNAIRKDNEGDIISNNPIHVQLVFAPKLQNVIFLPHGVGGEEIKLQAYMDNTLKYSIHNGETGPDYTKYTQYLGATDEEGKLTPKYPSTDNLITPATGEEQKIFGGWYLDEMCSDDKRFDPDTTEITGTTYVYAKWEDPWYVVQIDPAGGELKGGTDGGSTWFWVQHGDTVTSYSNIITRNYDEYEQGDFYYRQDTYQDYHGTYDFDKDASVTIDDKTYNLNDYNDPKHMATYQPIADADKETFAGTRYRRLEGVYQISRWDWQKVDSNGSPLTGNGNSGTDYVFGNPVTSHLKLTAVWEKVAPFKVVYDEGEGTLVENPSASKDLYGATDDASVYMDGASVTITKSAKPNDKNKHFLGWKVKGGAETIYPLNATYTVASQDADTDMTITLVAQYGTMELTSLRYDANGGEGTLSDVTVEDNSIRLWDANSNTLLNIERNDKVTLSGGAGFTRNGYYVVGWSKTKIDPAQTDNYFEYDAGTQKWNVKSGVADTFALGQEVIVDGATGNELYAVWKKGGLTIKVFTYENGAWQSGDLIHNGTYLQRYDDSGSGWLPENLLNTYNNPAKFTMPEGYAYAGGKVNGKTVKYVKQDGGEWKYAETEDGAYDEVGEHSLDIYYYKTITEVPVYYVTWDKATSTFSVIPEEQLIGSDGNRWLTDDSNESTALRQGDKVQVLSTNYNVRLSGSNLVVPGGSDNRLLYESDGNGGYKARNLRGYAVAPVGAATPTSDVKLNLALRTTESGVVWEVSDDTINNPVVAGTDNVLTNPAIYVIYGEPDTVKLTITKEVTGEMGDTNKEFSFTLKGLEAGTKVTYQRYKKVLNLFDTKDGEEKTVTANENGIVTFALSHGQKIALDIPSGSTITVTETNENYKTAINGEEKNSVVISNLSEETTVAVVNTLGEVAPTGVTLRFLPYLLILLGGGVMLLLMRRRRRLED